MSKVKISYIPLSISPEISCLDVSWFKMLVESSACCTNNEHKRTQMMKKDPNDQKEKSFDVHF